MSVVTAGRDRVQREGGPVEEVWPVDGAGFEPGERHRHGVASTIAMTHVAIQESLGGEAVEWLEAVVDEGYGA